LDERGDEADEDADPYRDLQVVGGNGGKEGVRKRRKRRRGEERKRDELEVVAGRCRPSQLSRERVTVSFI
jgi:hypothetical protein